EVTTKRDRNVIQIAVPSCLVEIQRSNATSVHRKEFHTPSQVRCFRTRLYRDRLNRLNELGQQNSTSYVTNRQIVVKLSRQQSRGNPCSSHYFWRDLHNINLGNLVRNKFFCDSIDP